MSTVRDDFNAIDPFRIDVSDGRAFLTFGSFWSGIKLRELDPATGMLLKDNTPVFALAGRQGGAIEASSNLEHEGKLPSSSASTSAARGWPRPTTFASAARTASRVPMSTGTART